MTGGYKILDFSDYTFTAGTAQTIEGIHKAVEETTKALLIENVVVGSTELKAEYATATGGSPYTIKLSTYTISIATNDSVTITANA